MPIIKLVMAVFFLLYPAMIFAQEGTATDAGSLTEKIKERLQETAEEGLVAIKEQLTAKANEPQKKAYIGKITSLDAAAAVLTYKDQNFSVGLTGQTEYYQGTSTEISFDDLTAGDFVISMGWFIPADDKFTAVRLSVIKDPEPPLSRQVIQGKIAEVDGQKIRINGKTLTLATKTTLLITGVDEPETEDISLGDYLFAIVTLDSNGDIDKVNTVYVQPGRQNPAALEPTNRPTTAPKTATDSGNVAQ